MGIIIIKDKNSKNLINYKVTNQLFARDKTEDSKMKLITTIVNKVDEFRAIELEDNIYYFFAKSSGYATSKCIQIDLINNKNVLIEVYHGLFKEQVKIIYNIKEAEKYLKSSSFFERIDKFKMTRNLNDLVLIDEINKVFFIPKSTTTKKFAFEDLESYELVDENHQNIYTTTKRKGIGRAIVGGALLGGVGAIVGASTGSSNSTTNIKNHKVEIIRLHIKSQHKTVDIELPKYFKNSKIEEILNYFDSILEENNSMKTDNENINDDLIEDNFEKIRKYKELLDDEIISQEEFEKKKKELLKL